MLNYRVYSYCLILSAIIFGVNPSSVSAQNNGNPQETEARKFINLVNQTESSYFLELQKFVDNFNDLKLTPPDNSYKYKLNLLNDGKLVQTIATPTKTTGVRTYTGALSYNNGGLNSILCGSRISSQFLADKIKLVNGQLKCPPGFQILLSHAQEDGSNSVNAINRAQQAYHFETSKFSNNQQELGFLPSNTYYDYQLQLLENGQLAQVVATPKFNNLKSYIGGIHYLNGSYQSIVCTSLKPTKSISQAIKLVDSKLECPTGFQI